jgi:hypothetical protein
MCCLFAINHRLLQWPLKTELRPRTVSFGLDRNAAVLLLHQFLNDGESHPGAFDFAASL